MLAPVGTVNNRVEERDAREQSKRRNRKAAKREKEPEHLAVDARGDLVDYKA